MHFDRNDQPALLEAAKAATFSTGWANDATCFGARDEDDALVGVIVFQRFAGGEAEVHFGMVGDRRVTPDIVKAVLLLGFHHNALNLTRMWGVIASDNPSAIVGAIKVGFEVEYRKRGGFGPGKDAIVLSMSRPDPALAPARRDDQVISE